MNVGVEARDSSSERLRSLPLRLAILAAVFTAEKLLLHFLVDLDAAEIAQGVAALVGKLQAQVFHLVATAAVCLALFSYVRSRQTGIRVFDAPAPTNIRVGWLILHALFVLPLAPLAFYLYRYPGRELHVSFLAALGALFAVAAILAGFRAMAPWRTWWVAARRLGNLWIYAVPVAAAATWGVLLLQKLWRPTCALTFELVRMLLHPFLPALSADPARLILSTERFSVVISEGCSGLEGVGLMLAFCSGWLLLFRAEYRFPRALILIPVGLLLVFALNSVRIASLVLIGDAGYPDIAVYGFHTQAGWIGFTLAAGTVVLLSRHVRWMNRSAHPGGVVGDSVDNPTATYLIPFLAMQAAAMLARAMSGRFDTLYSLRLVAGVAALVYFRSRLMSSKLDWRFSGRALAVGIVMFIVWVLAAKVWLTPAAMPDALRAFSPATRYAWIAGRALTAIAVVPIAEELAFRGYLMRRLIRADFESVPFGAVHLPALMLTALIFGVNYGVMWAPGIAAGLLYGWLAIRTGRIGESVAAHATTNALLAALVIFDGQWQFW